VAVHEDAGNPCCARRGELPVGIEFLVVDGDIVRVPFDAYVVGRLTKCNCDYFVNTGSVSGCGVAEPELKNPASRKLITSPSLPIWIATVCCAIWFESIFSILLLNPAPDRP
jgi:hypothetical protein